MRPSRGDPQLDHERIVDAAWGVVEEEGLAGLSSRRLAARLGVSSPALYHHISGINELYGMMIERLLRLAREQTPDGADWQAWMRELARNHCRVLLEHRDSGRIASLAEPTSRMRSEIVPDFSERLAKAGIPRQQALAATGALGSFILGYVINLQHGAHRELASSMHEVGDTFAFAIDAFIAALSAGAAEHEASTTKILGSAGASTNTPLA